MTDSPRTAAPWNEAVEGAVRYIRREYPEAVLAIEAEAAQAARAEIAERVRGLPVHEFNAQPWHFDKSHAVNRAAVLRLIEDPDHDR